MHSPRKLHPLDEARHRAGTLLLTVPRLLNRHLAAWPAGRRLRFTACMLARSGSYRKQFARPEDDIQLRRVKDTFLLVGVLYNELAKVEGAEQALARTQAFLHDLGCEVQRKAYFPPGGQARTWNFFHDAHEAQMEEGFISTNENGGIRRTDTSVGFEITRCRFHECFRDMGNAAITLAFCRSVETVFNEYSPALMRFHRGSSPINTIARGAPRCAFLYERVKG
jgi:hypothetical protein